MFLGRNIFPLLEAIIRIAKKNSVPFFSKKNRSLWLITKPQNYVKIITSKLLAFKYNF